MFLNSHKRRVLILSLLIMSSLLLFSCNKSDNKDIKDVEIFQEEYSKLLEDGNMLEAIEVLDDNVSYFDKTEATKAVEALMHYLYHYNFAEGNEFYQLLNYANDKNVKHDDIDSFFLNESNNEIKELYNTFKNNLYTIKVDSEESFVNELELSYIEINNDEIIKKYGKYIENDLLDLINLYKTEEVYIYDNVHDMVNLDKALSNIIQMENFVSSNNSSVYVNEVSQGLDYQYQAYFGYLDWSNVFDINDLIKDEAISHYTKTAETYNKLNVGQKASEYLNILKKESYLKTPNIEVFLLDLTNVEYESISE